MEDNIYKKVRCILDDSDFNELPEEERKKIIKYKDEQQILTLYQILHKNSDLTSVRWRNSVLSWLKNCVDLYYSKYGEKTEV